MDKIEKLLFGLISIIALLTCSVGLYQNEIHHKEKNLLIEEHNTYILSARCDMYDYDSLKYNDKFAVNGLYYNGNDFYTVWVKDRELSEIEETDKHEYCHYLIDNDYEHFCK